MNHVDLSPTKQFATLLDQLDTLASFRNQFVINDPNLIYLDGNSLGRLPKVAQEKAKQIMDEQWGNDLIREWEMD